MLKQLESRHELFDSAEEMLSPESLSSLLSKPVAHVERRPMSNHNGLAGGRLSYVDTDNGRYVLKNMSIDSDWIMYASDDQRGRSVRLWQYGLLDRLRPFLEHQTIACGRDDEGWAILMHDLGDGIHWRGQAAATDAVPQFLNALARMHATFWNDPLLLEDRVGLCDPARLLDQSALPVARGHTNNSASNSPIPVWVVEGWEIMSELLDPEVFEAMHTLIENPSPLFKALDHYPFTLLHGDYRDANLAVLAQGQLVAFDWQEAAHCLMTVDLAWYTNDIRDLITLSQAHSFYRERLEGYLRQEFDDQYWEAMLDLGYLVNALRSTCFTAYFSRHGDNPEWRKSEKAKLVEEGRQAHRALRWL